MHQHGKRYEVQYDSALLSQQGWSGGFIWYDGATLGRVHARTPPSAPLHAEKIGDALDHASASTWNVGPVTVFASGVPIAQFQNGRPTFIDEAAARIADSFEQTWAKR